MAGCIWSFRSDKLEVEIVSAAPEPAENSAGAALVPAPWEISARAALRTKPQRRGRAES